MNPLSQMVKPCLVFDWVAPDKGNAVDSDLGTLLPPSSHIGGNPLLPPDFVWPTTQAADKNGHSIDRALIFCAQINLADIKDFVCAALLPDHGIFCISVEDLKNRNFDHVECEMQCY